jgi:hypothetical protein
VGFDLKLVNPLHIKQMPGRKSDAKDAQWIAELLHKNMLRGSLVPGPLIQELRTYTREYRILVNQRTKVLTQMDRILVMCGIRLSSCISNLDSKSFMQVVEALVCGNTDPGVLVRLVYGNGKNKESGKLKACLTGNMKEKVEADYFIFPVVLEYAYGDVDVGTHPTLYRVILNELDIDLQIYPSGYIPELKGLRWYVNEKVFIDAMPGYGISPFLKIGKLIEIIFLNFGYTLEENPFASHRQLKKLVVLNKYDGYNFLRNASLPRPDARYDRQRISRKSLLRTE